MASLTQKVDDFFNRIDGAIEGVNRVVNRGQQSTNKLGGDASAKVAPGDGTTAIARKRVYRTIESIDGETGKPVFLVTDGTDRCECSSLDLADRVCRGLNTEKR